jgi:hypothetical protein
MQLIHALAAGIAGAESGTAVIYRRGTSSLVNYYTDFEATAPLTQGAGGIDLDEFGATVVYVDDICTVVVRNQGGATVRTFTAGNKDSAVEVISDSFTGTNYTSGATGVSQPTTLQAVLDRWNDSAGTSNFQVMVGGAATNIQTAIAGLSGVFYNVKSADYGADGDGTTDDYAACQAAIDAAETAGGGIVFFPAGTYRITQMLTVPHTVSLLGTGPECTHLKLDAATASGYSALYFEGTTSTHYRFQSLREMRISCNQANAEEAVRVADPYLLMENVAIVGDDAGFTSILLDTVAVPTALHVVMRNCFLSLAPSNNGSAINMESPSSSSLLEMHGTRIVQTGTSFNTSGVVYLSGSGSTLRALGCVVDATTATTLNTSIVLYSEGKMYVHNCSLLGAANHGATFISLSSIDATVGQLVESGNSVYPSNNQLYGGATAGLLDQMHLSSRITRAKVTSTTSATVTLDPREYAVERIQKTSGTTLTVNALTNVIPLGHRVTLSIWADNLGGNLSVTLGTGFKGLSWIVNDNSVETADFISAAGPGGTIYLYQIAATTDVLE